MKQLKEKFFIFSLLMIAVLQSVNAQRDYKEFNATEYLSSLYKIKSQNFSLNAYSIKLIKVFNKGDENENAFYCRAWLKVLLKDSLIDSIYFDNMVPGKGCSGIYTDNEQPLLNYFLLVKYGNYDGRTIIIDSKGKIHNIIGGKYFLTRDKRYLFSIYESDLSGISIYDFKTNKSIYTNDSLTTKLNQWYFQEGRCFSLDQEGDEEEVETENPNFSAMFFQIRYFDFTKKQMKTDKLNFENLREENAIELLPAFKRAPDCLCK
ncbi:MAG: hypothetical protein ABI723_21355 [Bacteroidia bacterium]